MKIIFVFLALLASAHAQLLAMGKQQVASATPGFVGAFGTSNNGASAVGTKTDSTCITNAVCTHLPTASLSGNTIVVAAEWNDTATSCNSSSAVAITTTDNADTYTAGPTAHDTTNHYWLALFYKTNATTGTFNLVATYAGACTNAEVMGTQFSNIATSSPVDGTAVGTSIVNSSTSVPAGSITTTVNNDLILQFACRTQTKTETNLFTTGSGFSALTEDFIGGCLSQYQVQSASGAINPTLTWDASGGTTVAIALKSATQGTAPSGMYAALVQAVDVPATMAKPATVTAALASHGNLLVDLASCADTAATTETQAGITSITDTASNYWNTQWVNTAEVDGASRAATQIAYANNATPGHLKLTMKVSNMKDCTFKLVDVVGAGTVSGATRSPATGNSASTGSTMTMLSSKTPGITSGLVFATCGVDFNTAISMTAPTSGSFIADTYGGMSISGPDTLDQNNCWGYAPVASNSAINNTWGVSRSTLAVGNWAGELIGFADGSATKSGQTVSYTAGLPCSSWGVSPCISTAASIQLFNWTPATSQNPAASSSLTVGGTNPVIVVAVALNSATATVSSVTWSLGSGTAASIKSVRNSNTYVNIWCIPAPVQGLGTVTVALSASVDWQMTTMMFEHADQTTPCPTGDAASASGTNVTTLTPAPTNMTSSDAQYGMGAITVAGDVTSVSGTTVVQDFLNDTTNINAEAGHRIGTVNPIFNFNAGATQKAAAVTVRIKVVQ